MDGVLIYYTRLPVPSKNIFIQQKSVHWAAPNIYHISLNCILENQLFSKSQDRETNLKGGKEWKYFSIELQNNSREDTYYFRKYGQWFICTYN